MDSKRFLLALALSVAVLFAFQTLFPVKPVPGTTNGDSTQVAAVHADSANAPAATPTTNAPSSAVTALPATVPSTQNNAVRADSAAVPSTTVTPAQAEMTVIGTRPDSGVQYTTSSIGAAPVSVTINAYENRSPAGGKVNLASARQPLIKYHLVTNKSQPVDLSTVPFSTTRDGNVVTYRATVAGADVAIRYTFVPDTYAVHVSGAVATAAGDTSGTYLLIDLPHTFSATEADTADDRKHLAYAYNSKREGARSVLFSSLDPGEKTLVEGPLTWIAAKSKYFVVGLLAPVNGPQFTEATLVGGARTSKVATNASATVVVPIKNGAFAFDMYTGPQSLKPLQHMGRDFHDVNPYGWAFTRAVMQPIATGVTKLVLWMHNRLALSYGLVLVVLGVLVRVVLWPLNQSAMRSSFKMQRLQPELQEVQSKYKDDPEKQRTEIMKVYASHGMSPLSPLLGCLPMLIPMPVLLALFFVFQNTIEFRGAQFLWMNDLSAMDPYYILPVIMGISMYLLSWIGMRNTPPNPQAKMMSYVMPAMFLVFLGRAAAGLNLYYAVQNIAALPQQWLISRERTKQKTQS